MLISNGNRLNVNIKRFFSTEHNKKMLYPYG